MSYRQGGYVQLVGSGVEVYRDWLVNKRGGEVISQKEFKSVQLGLSGFEIRVKVSGEVVSVCQEMVDQAG
jgi:hypothetical protein